MVIIAIVTFRKTLSSAQMFFCHLQRHRKYIKLQIIIQMGIHYTKVLCCQQSEEHRKPIVLSKTPQKVVKRIVEDFNRMREDKWFRFHNKTHFDANKFIFMYTDYNEQQQLLLSNWNKVDMKLEDKNKLNFNQYALSSRWKYVIRKGVPIIHYKTMIGVLFNKNFQIGELNSQYLMKLSQVMKYSKKSKILYFGVEGIIISDIVHGDFLNSAGWKAIENISLLLTITKAKITINKFLPHVIAIMLIFLQEAETHYIISLMIDNSTNMSQQRLQSLSWHFTVNESQLHKFCSKFFEIFSESSTTIRQIHQHFSKYRINGEEILMQIIENFFYGYLPFPAILKMFLIYLNEGIKVFMRVFYGMLKNCHEVIMQKDTKQKVLVCIRRRCLLLDCSERWDLFKKSHIIRFENQIYDEAKYLRQEDDFQDVKYYLPSIRGQSQIMSFEDVKLSLSKLEKVWRLLPGYLKSFDIEKKFPIKTNSKIYNVSGILQSITDKKFCSLIIIQSVNQAIFGIFLSNWLYETASDKQFKGSAQNFIFKLYPNVKKYTCTGQNIHYWTVPNQKYIQIGSGYKGPALTINFDLQSGSSYESNTYRNEKLHNEDNPQFKIKRIEVFSFY